MVKSYANALLKRWLLLFGLPLENKWLSLAMLGVYLITFILLAKFIIYAGGAIGADEGIWFYIAKCWAKLGVAPYIGGVENKPPGLFYLYSLAVLWDGAAPQLPLRIFSLLFMCWFGLYFSKFTNRIARADAAFWMLAIYTFLVFSKKTEFLNVAASETYMFVLCGIAFILYIGDGYNRPSKKRIFLSGIVIGIAILFRQTGIAIAAALTCASFFIEDRWRGAVFAGVVLWSGILVGHMLGLVPFLVFGGSLSQYFNAAWVSLLNLHISYAKPLDLHSRFEGFVALIGFWIPFFSSALLLPVVRRELGVTKWFSLSCLLWLLFDLLATLSSGEYYKHQFKQLIPAVALCSGLGIAGVIRRILPQLKEGIRILPAICLLPLMTLVNVWQFSSLKLSVDFEKSGIIANSGLIANRMTDVGDYVYICEHRASATQYYCGRYSPTRHFNTMFIFGIPEQQEVLSALEKNPPRLIMVWNKWNSISKVNKPPDWIMHGYIIPKGYQQVYKNSDYIFWGNAETINRVPEKQPLI